MPNFVSELLKLADKYKECNVFHARRIIKNESTGETYEDEFVLIITENRKNQKFDLTVDELLDLYQEIKHAVETNIC